MMTSSSGAIGYDWAKPGVKVVCIKTWVNKFSNDSNEGYERIVGPTEGQILTIRDVFWNEFLKEGPRVVFRFEEIRNPIVAYSGGERREQSFAAEYYQPLVEKKLPQSLTCLLKNPKSVILPNEGQKFDTREKVR